MKDQLVKFWKDEEGATAIEYALIAGLIAVVIIGALTVLGNRVTLVFDNIADALKDVPGAGAGAGAGAGNP
ncbi:MAG: Flp family type IVb pilin [Advenella sp.]|uniref:Flp family type IVb pilin n=1 Tax=Advenella sp. TaxID=1872388 RepID=UPI00258B15D5|nr:Flp family type IVb pilin [Advenella sp.]MDD3758293.1 Flp family type IVb pilin [Advenella sp.]